jgi:hypothetical protein
MLSIMPGLDKGVLDEIHWETVAQWVNRDTRTDFIFAPHYNI